MHYAGVSTARRDSHHPRSEIRPRISIPGKSLNGSMLTAISYLRNTPHTMAKIAVSLPRVGSAPPRKTETYSRVMMELSGVPVAEIMETGTIAILRQSTRAGKSIADEHQMPSFALTDTELKAKSPARRCAGHTDSAMVSASEVLNLAHERLDQGEFGVFPPRRSGCRSSPIPASYLNGLDGLDI